MGRQWSGEGSAVGVVITMSHDVIMIGPWQSGC
jgi:hypothetical protein